MSGKDGLYCLSLWYKISLGGELGCLSVVVGHQFFWPFTCSKNSCNFDHNPKPSACLRKITKSFYIENMWLKYTPCMHGSYAEPILNQSDQSIWPDFFFLPMVVWIILIPCNTFYYLYFRLIQDWSCICSYCFAPFCSDFHLNCR